MNAEDRVYAAVRSFLHFHRRAPTYYDLASATSLSLGTIRSCVRKGAYDKRLIRTSNGRRTIVYFAADVRGKR